VRFETYHFEVKDLLIQFCNAFDSVVIKRFNDQRETVSKINVRYVYSPKQRVLFDLVNKAQNIDLPCIAVSIGGVSRDDSRVFNKLDGFYQNNVAESYFYKTPVPVNIDVNMSIIAKYQTDIDQILSNFVPYTNPYIIISWKVPTDIQLAYMQEIRSEVMWNGGISLSYPTEIDGGTKYRVTADTSFTIKGWLFRNDNNPVSNVYTVSSNFYAVSAIDLDADVSTDTLQAYNNSLSGVKETVVVKALPDKTQIQLVYDNNEVNTTYFNLNNLPTIILNGGFLSDLPQMEYTRRVFLSANQTNILPVLSAVDFFSGTSVSANNPPFSAYDIKSNGGDVLYAGSIISITLPPLSTACDFKIIVSNESGYKSYVTGVLQ
jgi:Arc/MetJ family transcription regulator